MTDTTDFAEAQDFAEAVLTSDLVLGFSWHEEGQHWDLETYSFPDSFTDQQANRLEELAEQFGSQLTREGLRPETGGES